MLQAFTGGYSSYLLALDPRTYERLGTDTPGNRPEDTYLPTMNHIIPYMLVIALIGVFMIVVLRKVGLSLVQ